MTAATFLWCMAVIAAGSVASIAAESIGRRTGWRWFLPSNLSLVDLLIITVAVSALKRLTDQ